MSLPPTQWGARWWAPSFYSTTDSKDLSFIESPATVGGKLCGMCRYFQPEVSEDNEEKEYGDHYFYVPIALPGCCLFFFPIVISNLLSWATCPNFSELIRYEDDEFKG
jgi:hypothetical protein